MYDLHNDLSPVTSIQPQAVAAPVNGAGVSLVPFSSAVILVGVGEFAGTTPTATIVIQESDDDSAYTAVAAGDLYGGQLPAISTTTDETLYERGYKGRKPYLRVAVTAIAGENASLPMNAVIVRGHPSIKPA